VGKETRTIIPENLVKPLQQAVIDSERDNPDSHGAEVRFAQRVARYPEIIKLRYLRIRRIIRLTGALKGTVLDIGAGKCLNAALALIAGAREVYAVDMDEQRYQSARFLLEHLDKSTSFGFRERVHLINADVLQLNLSTEQFNAAWSMELLEHIADSVQLHRMVYRWLKYRGKWSKSDQGAILVQRLLGPGGHYRFGADSQADYPVTHGHKRKSKRTGCTGERHPWFD
jgi:2-polyprenyl-3-methyl-5-hydroxy-6-metoxy-1,4-benzoquinol methylase